MVAGADIIGTLTAGAQQKGMPVGGAFDLFLLPETLILARKVWIGQAQAGKGWRRF